jgi:hypothetical protein
MCEASSTSGHLKIEIRLVKIANLNLLEIRKNIKDFDEIISRGKAAVFNPKRIKLQMLFRRKSKV